MTILLTTTESSMGRKWERKGRKKQTKKKQEGYLKGLVPIC